MRSAVSFRVGVERSLRHGDVVAPVAVGEHRLAAGRHPAHRPPGLARREGDREVLRIGRGLHSEAAAHVRRRHPHRRLVEPHGARELVAQAPDALAGEGEVQPRAVPLGEAAAGLDRHRLGPVVDELEARGVRRRGEGALHRRLVAVRPVEGEVVRRLRMDGRPADGRRHVDRQVLEIEGDHLRRVEARLARLRHHDRERLAGEAHRGVGQRRPPRVGATRAVTVLHHRRRRWSSRACRRSPAR